MDFKDYYARLGVERTASAADIKRAYRRLARKYHPDVSKEADAEAQFKEVAEAYEALKDPERRAAYDEVQRSYRSGSEFRPPPDWARGFGPSGGAAGPEDVRGSDFDRSEFFDTLFGQRFRQTRSAGPQPAGRGADHHARVQVPLQEAYQGGRRSISLQVPQHDASGRMTLVTRQLELRIPKGVRAGQQLRLAGQGEPGSGAAPAGDLYLEIEFAPDARFRVDGRDVFIDLPLAPWEAALGASVVVVTPAGEMQVRVPAGSASGSRLRLKGQGIPADPPGDLYAVLTILLPGASSAAEQQAWRDFAAAFPQFDPRRGDARSRSQ